MNQAKARWPTHRRYRERPGARILRRYRGKIVEEFLKKDLEKKSILPAHVGYPARKCYRSGTGNGDCKGPLCVREFPASQRWSLGDPFLCLAHLRLRGLAPRQGHPEEWIFTEIQPEGSP